MAHRKLSIIPLMIIVLFHTGTIFAIISLLGYSVEQAALFSILIYLALSMLMLSPVGEFLMCLLCGGRRIERKDWCRKTEHALSAVYDAAHRNGVRLPENVRLYYVYNPLPTSFSFGRKTVCLSSALLDDSPLVIEAFIAHEMEHVRYCDSVLLQLANAGNLPWICAGAVLRWVSRGVRVFSAFNRFHILGLVLFLINGLLLIPRGVAWLVLSLTQLIISIGSRRKEYEADAFAVRLGFGRALRTALLASDYDGQNTRDLWQSLVASHPGVHDRVGRIDRLMCANKQQTGVTGEATTCLLDVLNS